MKPTKLVLIGFLIACSLFVWIAWTVSNSNYNSNQFGAVYPNLSIKSGVLLTNTVLRGSTTGDAGTIADSLLSANIPLINGNNNWTGTTNNFGGNVGFSDLLGNPVLSIVNDVISLSPPGVLDVGSANITGAVFQSSITITNPAAGTSNKIAIAASGVMDVTGGLNSSNDVFTSSTLWGSVGQTNKTFTDANGWWHTNLTTGSYAHFQSGGLTVSNAVTSAAFVTPTNTPVAGYEVIATSTGGSTAYKPPPLNTLDTTTSIIVDDFPNQTGTAMQIGTHGWYFIKQGGGSGAPGVSVTNHPGVFTIATGTTSTDGALLILGNVTNSVNEELYPNLNATTGWTNTWIFRLTATNDVNAYMGLVNNLVSMDADPTNFIGLIFSATNSANWSYMVESNAVVGRLSSGLQAETAGYHKFQMWETTPGQISFSMDGANSGVITTNCPTTAMSPTVVIYKTAANNSASFNVDYFSGVMTGLTR